MTIQDQVDSDKVDVMNAEAALEAAKSKLALSQAQLDAIQPHLSLLQEFVGAAERHAASMESDINNEFLILVSKAKALL